MMPRPPEVPQHFYLDPGDVARYEAMRLPPYDPEDERTHQEQFFSPERAILRNEIVGIVRREAATTFDRLQQDGREPDMNLVVGAYDLGQPTPYQKLGFMGRAALIGNGIKNKLSRNSPPAPTQKTTTKAWIVRTWPEDWAKPMEKRVTPRLGHKSTLRGIAMDASGRLLHIATYADPSRGDQGSEFHVFGEATNEDLVPMDKVVIDLHSPDTSAANHPTTKAWREDLLLLRMKHRWIESDKR